MEGKTTMDEDRNYCAICSTELSSGISSVRDWGCDCDDLNGNEHRCCEKCHNEHHSPDKMAYYDDETYKDTE